MLKRNLFLYLNERRRVVTFENMKERRTFVAYYRVSTHKQGVSGLGLKAQKKTVLSRVDSEGGFLLAEYIEIQSGRFAGREELQEAIEHCKRSGATLLIAKLDRLARDVEFLFSLRNSGVDFVACDLPDLNTMTLALFASFAQHEAERISQRTAEALREKRERDGEWRVSNLDEKSRLRGARTNKRRAEEHPANRRALSTLRLIVEGAQSRGEKRPTLQFLADYLNEGGFRTPKQKQFTKTQVSRLLKRAQLD